MSKNPVLDVALSEVMRPEIALPLQHILKIYTVGNLLSAWRNPKNQRSIEQVFDSPQQARHAMTVCTAWLGFQTPAICTPIAAWWNHESRLPINVAGPMSEEA